MTERCGSCGGEIRPHPIVGSACLCSDRAGITAPPRSGSFPLMNLAADYGLDYGDLLLYAGWLRDERLGGSTQGRALEALYAFTRMHRTLSVTRQEAMVQAMGAHADARWGHYRR